MAHSRRPLGRISETRLRPTAATIGLLILAVSVMVTNRPAQAQTYTLLYEFKDTPDGSIPSGTLLRDKRGNLYGTTTRGGTSKRGIVFRVTAGGKETVLYRFKTTPDGKTPRTGLVVDTTGNGYGTTPYGGAHGFGTIYKLNSHTGKETVLYSFSGQTDGKFPMGGLIVDAANNFYGTSFEGGNVQCNHGCGAVFKMDHAGNVTVLHDFSAGTDASNPYGNLVLDAAGNLYGTTELGGTYGAGSIFKVDTSGNETVLYSFTGGTDGSEPESGLAWDTSGNLYGTTSSGGLSCLESAYGCGTVFKFDPTTTLFSVLHIFTGMPDGSIPVAGVVVDPLGNVYGTTIFGGSFDRGTVFKVDATGVESVVYSFTDNTGAEPQGALILDSAGNLYGTTANGGTFDAGVVFELTP